MDFLNSTHLDTERLSAMCHDAIADWPHDGVRAAVRYSRGAAFSGTCFYKEGRIFVNLGRTNAYPYLIRTNLARAQSERNRWWRELYTIDAADPYQLVLFVFMHEFYHWLVRQARRNVRQKEARCDRFAARAMVDMHGSIVRDSTGKPVPRHAWDFQDLDGFVARARRTWGRAG